jgi:glutathione S-transferase
MVWVHLVILFALLQLIVFAVAVGKARDRFGVKAPAVMGNENFERYYRVQMNSIEMIVVFIPSILLAASYWSPFLIAAIGLIYVVGRILYFNAYVADKKRTAPFLMSFIPNIFFVVAAIIGAIRVLMYT